MSSHPAATTRLLLLLIGCLPTGAALAQETPATEPPATETPQPVTVVSRGQLDQRNVQTVEQALAYTPEASVDVSGYDPLGDAVDIRGFAVGYTSIYRDGLRQTAADLAIPRIEPYGADSVTVLRGPAAGIYGSGSAGGILAVTTKRPQFDPFGEVQLQGGNFGRLQGNFDLGGPVEGSDGTVAYRMTGLLRQSGTYLPGAPDDRVYLAPAVTWKPDADTSFTVLTEYLHARLPSNPTYYFFPGYVVTRLYQGAPGYGVLDQEQFRIGYAFEHRFSPDLIVRQNLRYYGVHADFPAVRLNLGQRPDELADGIAKGYAFLSQENLGTFTVDNQVEGRTETGPVAHTLIGGIDYNHYDYNRLDGRSRDTDIPILADGRLLVQPPMLRNRLRQSEDQVGVYLQEQAKLDPFLLTLNGRLDRVTSQTTRFFDAAPLGAQGQDFTAFTYRVGLNYQLTPDLVPYASYATYFTPQPGAGNGDPFPPATGQQLEAGIKVSVPFPVPDKTITGSVSGFDITQSAFSNRDLATVFFQVPIGSVEARGFEMEATANLAPGTSLTLAFRHLDFRFTQQTATVVVGRDAAGREQLGTISLDGNLAAGVPGDTFSAFGTYLFPTGSLLAGLTLGGGVRFSGTSFADDLNTVRNPTVTLFDATLAYDFAAIDPKYKGFRAQINGFNVLDRTYTNCQNLFCYRGAPATVIGSLVYRW